MTRIHNSRALRLKDNSEEFDEKLADIRRLTGTLSKFVSELISAAKGSSSTQLRVCHDIDSELRVTIIFASYRSDVNIEFDVYCNHIALVIDSQFDLDIVRRVHNNLDVLIECAEKICEAAGCLKAFHSRMARFGM